MYEQSSKVRANEVIWPLMGVSAPVDITVVIEYGSRTLTAAEPVIEELDDKEEAAEECDEWEQAVVDATPVRSGGQRR